MSMSEVTMDADDNLVSAFESGQPILAYLSGGEVRYWDMIEPDFTGEVRLHFTQGAIGAIEDRRRRTIVSDGEVELREG